MLLKHIILQRVAQCFNQTRHRLSTYKLLRTHTYSTEWCRFCTGPCDSVVFNHNNQFRTQISLVVSVELAGVWFSVTVTVILGQRLLQKQSKASPVVRFVHEKEYSHRLTHFLMLVFGEQIHFPLWDCVLYQARKTPTYNETSEI